MLEILAYAALALAVLPAVMTAVNLAVFRAPPPRGPAPRPSVSLLIPARDEEANIGAALDAALASEGVELEVLVLDDGSTDRTAAIVAAHLQAMRACGSSPHHRCHLVGPASSTHATSSPATRATRCWCSPTPMCASRPMPSPASPACSSGRGSIW